MGAATATRRSVQSCCSAVGFAPRTFAARNVGGENVGPFAAPRRSLLCYVNQAFCLCSTAEKMGYLSAAYGNTCTSLLAPATAVPRQGSPAEPTPLSTTVVIAATYQTKPFGEDGNTCSPLLYLRAMSARAAHHSNGRQASNQCATLAELAPPPSKKGKTRV